MLNQKRPTLKMEIKELLEQVNTPYVIQDVFYFYKFKIKFMRVVTIHPEYRQSFYIDCGLFIKIPRWIYTLFKNNEKLKIWYFIRSSKNDKLTILIEILQNPVKRILKLITDDEETIKQFKERYSI